MSPEWYRVAEEPWIDPAAPERAVAVADPPPGEVLRRDEGDGEAAELHRLPPAKPHVLDLLLAERRVGLESGQHGRADGPERGHVHVVPVVVGDEAQVDVGKLLGAQRGRDVAPHHPRGPHPVAEHRVEEERDAVQLHEEARVPEPGDARPLALRRGRSQPLPVGHDGGNGSPIGGRALGSVEPVEDLPAEQPSEPVGLPRVEIQEAPLLVARLGWRRRGLGGDQEGGEEVHPSARSCRLMSRSQSPRCATRTGSAGRPSRSTMRL